MAVIDSGNIFPKPNITVEQPDKAESVEFDDGTEHTGLLDSERFEMSADHSDLHTPQSTDMFEAPGPVSVVLDGYGLEGETTSPQVKLARPKSKSKPKSTVAETK